MSIPFDLFALGDIRFFTRRLCTSGWFLCRNGYEGFALQAITRRD